MGKKLQAVTSGSSKELALLSGASPAWPGKAKEGSTRQIAVTKGSAPHTMEHRGTVTATQRDNDGWGTEMIT